MNLTFFSSDKEEIFLVSVEVEAHTTGKSVHKCFLLALDESLVLINDKSQLDDLFSFKLVLHQGPAADSSITGDRVEEQVLDIWVRVPSDLPDWVGMLGSSNGGLIDWLVVSLQPDIEDHDGTIVETDSEESWVLWMEVDAHNSGLGGEGVLWPGWVLDSITADQTSALLQEIVGTITDSEEILVLWVPLDGSDMLLS